MKIVVLDGYTLNPGDLNWSALEALGETVIYDRTSKEDIISRIGDASVILTNKTPLTDEIFEACKNIKYVGVLATGYNVVDVKSAKEHGVIVTNIPTYGTTAVAQFVFALLLELCHRVGHHSDRVAQGAWASSKDFCFWDYPLVELYGKTIGIIGFGRIGHQTSLVARGFGMNVLAFDSYVNKEWEKEGVKYVSLDTLLEESDVISLHCPLFPETEKIINAKSLAKAKDGVKIINTSRGPLIDEDALYQALESGKVSGAAMDVLTVEPPKGHNRLSTHPNCIVTPHIAWAPKESRLRLLNIAIENIKQFINNTPVNVVNK
ncbi:MAG: D-2-hydroxyacid dehydrogenase [Sphaerochaetaceae bacterium]|nr:D-2-hydroxyacid dehydrogenase [Sphaerochaetaceae bacterium]MDC7243268.1 D-2-hydroxyacid dehydrogenase [Sphaerochaetaceae bacterium]